MSGISVLPARYDDDDEYKVDIDIDDKDNNDKGMVERREKRDPRQREG